MMEEPPLAGYQGSEQASGVSPGQKIWSVHLSFVYPPQSVSMNGLPSSIRNHSRWICDAEVELRIRAARSCIHGVQGD